MIQPWEYGPPLERNHEEAGAYMERIRCMLELWSKVNVHDMTTDFETQQVKIAQTTPEGKLQMISITVAVDEYNPDSGKLKLARKQHFLGKT